MADGTRSDELQVGKKRKASKPKERSVPKKRPAVIKENDKS